MTQHRTLGWSLGGLATCALFLLPAQGGAQTVIPAGWRWLTDRPAPIRAEQAGPDSSWRFVEMAPGWHITTRPGALMYHPDEHASGSFQVESRQVLFPGESLSGYGLFVGGSGLDTGQPAYLAFLVRRDGHVAVERASGATRTLLVPWTPAGSVKIASGRGTVVNTLAVSVDADSVRFTVNGERVAGMARAGLPVDGGFGFRTGADIDLHVTTLNHTRHLAPVPKPPR